MIVSSGSGQCDEGIVLCKFVGYIPDFLFTFFDDVIFVEQVAGWVAEDCQFREGDEVSTFFGCAEGCGANFVGVAREVADGGIDLSECDFHVAVIVRLFPVDYFSLTRIVLVSSIFFDHIARGGNMGEPSGFCETLMGDI